MKKKILRFKEDKNIPMMNEITKALPYPETLP